ncbi:unnamed protein product [Periconia digitata]|uniref:IDI-2 n=1 Tax=Periconia digitata TaxID=1303443 RepID=A0A9W4XUQ7_9PLEO|nr:unnamed protein product [Periconia digitata]
MKFTAATLFFFLGASMATATAEPVSSAVTNDCLALGGLLDTRGLVGTEHRKCSDHPLQHDSLQKRSCAVRNYGCEKGYCWKKCREGKDQPWCWMAKNYGSGAWNTCGKDSECEPSKLGASDCGVCNKGTCGCTC